MPNARPGRLAIAGLIVLVLIWSVGWTTMKVATLYSGPMTFSLHRYVVGSIVLFGLMLALKRPLTPTPWGPTMLIGLTQTAAFQAFEQWALMVGGGAGKTALLAYTMPFFVVPLAWWWVKEAPERGHWVAVALAAAGFLLVVEPWAAWAGVHSLEADLLAIAGGFFWAVGTVLSRRLFLRRPDIRPLQLTAWQMLCGATGLAVVVLASGEGVPHWTGPYVGAVLYNGVLSSAIGWFLWSYLVHELPAGVAGLTSLAVPVTTILLSWWFFGEMPNGNEWAGIVLVGGAILALGFLPVRRAGNQSGR